jgi:FkbM family methyltransferase
MGLIARQIRRMLPVRWQPIARYHYEWAMGMLEREMPLAIAAVKPGDTVVDVGANVGLYTYAFARAGARVEAFEPQAEWSEVLSEFASARRAVRVHPVALGTTDGTAMLTIPVAGDERRPGNASLRSGSAGVTEQVAVKTLDSFDFEQVSLIKIDVEGAELDVLSGATGTLRAHWPLLLVEIEERHHQGPIMDVLRWLAALEYDGFFLDARRSIVPVSGFDIDRHQRQPLARPETGPYINNFLFQPRRGSRRWI